MGAILETHMHFQKQREVKINPGDFAGMEAWSFLAGRMQVGINRAVGIGSEIVPAMVSVPWGGCSRFGV